MFKKKNNKPIVKNAEKQVKKSTAKVKKPQTGKPVVKGQKPQDKSDEMLAKLMEIEKETRLKQVRDNVGQLEDEKIAEHLELLLKSMWSEEKD